VLLFEFAQLCQIAHTLLGFQNKMVENVPEVLQRSLYIFSLPAEILNTITLKTHQHQQESQDSPPEKQEIKETTPLPESGDAKQDAAPTKATSCNLCGLNFGNLPEQRSHVKSDLHSYNLKQRLKGLKPVSENEFEKLIGDLDESISGSESSESESETEQGNDTTLTALLKKQAKTAHPEESATKRSGGQPLIWLGSSSLPSNVSLGVYRALFAAQDLDHVVDIVKQKQFLPVVQTSKKSTVAAATPQASPSYFLCMVGGGHFAAMVVSLAPKLVTTHKGANERQAIVLAHKTFHRYTTRRKQGGAQSASDGAKGAAHSAGANIRRANEVALNDEIRALLNEWKSMIDDCELVFIRAAGSMNRKTLFGPYDGQVLRSNDSRNRGFPFTTRRATQSELMRAFQELTRVKISYIDETALETASAKQEDPTPAPRPKPKPRKPTAEKETTILHSTQLSALIKRSKVPALVSYIQSNNIDLKTFVFLQAPHHSPLHLASHLGSAPVISALLVKCGANPMIRNEDGKTPVEVAKDRSTRDAFRLARFSLGESAWDWDSAVVGAALNPADAAARAARDKETEEEEAKKEAERRRVETERLRREDGLKEDADREKRIGKGRALGEMTGTDKRELEGRGMTPEMRMRLERERRARAAEARLRGR
jgi:hypothetical protein